jgi:hypothetical protein
VSTALLCHRADPGVEDPLRGSNAPSRDDCLTRQGATPSGEVSSRISAIADAPPEAEVGSCLRHTTWRWTAASRCRSDASLTSRVAARCGAWFAYLAAHPKHLRSPRQTGAAGKAAVARWGPCGLHATEQVLTLRLELLLADQPRVVQLGQLVHGFVRVVRGRGGGANACGGRRPNACGNRGRRVLVGPFQPFRRRGLAQASSSRPW